MRERATGAEVSKALSPGQQVVKIVNEELASLMGGTAHKLSFACRPPTVVMLAGLNGTARRRPGKLALFVRKLGKNPYLVACDISAGSDRPAAADRARARGACLLRGHEPAPEEIAERGIKAARDAGYDFVIVDTAGRQVVDVEMMEELKRVRKASQAPLRSSGARRGDGPERGRGRAGFPGVRGLRRDGLTKLDGDARWCGPLVVSVTGRPIRFASEGEKMSEFDYFYPDRMAGRILGMGDVLTLIEKAEQQMDREEAPPSGSCPGSSPSRTSKQMQMLKKMGPLGLLGMIPGMGKQLQGAQIDDRMLGRVEAMVTSMTARERQPQALAKPEQGA